MKQEHSIESSANAIVVALEQKLEEIRVLTCSLTETTKKLDNNELEEGLRCRRILLEEAEQLKKQALANVTSTKERETLWQRLASVVAAVKYADEEFVNTLGKKKKEVGEKLSHLYRQQKIEQYNHGGDYGNQ